MPCKIWNKSTFEQHDAFYTMKYFQPKEIETEDDQNRESQIDTNMIQMGNKQPGMRVP